MNEIKNFSDKTRLKNHKKKQVHDNVYKFFAAREVVLNDFKSKIFVLKSKGSGILNTDHSKLKILTPKQVLQWLPVALAQVKAGNSENLLSEIRQIVYSLYHLKEITKKVYNNIIRSIKKWIQYLWIQRIVKLLNKMY